MIVSLDTHDCLLVVAGHQVMLAELLGTFFIVLSYSLSDGHALATALAVIVQVYSLSHVSMGQFNPAVTIGLLATQAIGVWQAICTILMQVRVCRLLCCTYRVILLIVNSHTHTSIFPMHACMNRFLVP